MYRHDTALADLYCKLDQINQAIAALEEIQRARARRAHPLQMLRRRRRAPVLHFQRSSKKPDNVIVLPSIPMSA